LSDLKNIGQPVTHKLNRFLQSWQELLTDKYYDELVEIAQGIRRRLLTIKPLPIQEFAQCSRILGWALLLQDEEAELTEYFKMGCPPGARVGDSAYHEAQLGIALCALLEEDDELQLKVIEEELRRLELLVSAQSMSAFKTYTKRVIQIYHEG